MPVPVNAPPVQPAPLGMGPPAQPLPAGAMYPPQQQQPLSSMPVPDIRVEPVAANYSTNV